MAEQHNFAEVTAVFFALVCVRNVKKCLSFQIIFEGIVGTGGTGFIAIDNILMKQHQGITEKNCLFTSSYARPRPPTPSPPPSARRKYLSSDPRNR